MRAALDLIVFTVVIFLIFHLSNLADRLKREAELKKRGVINHLDSVVCVKGSPDLQGSTISLYMYEDRISINETFCIPLDRVKMAETFKVNEVRVTRTLAGQNSLLKFPWSKKIWFAAYLLCKLKTNRYLSIEYTDQQDNVCRIISLAVNPANFAATVNHQIKGEYRTCSKLYAG